MFDNSLIPIAHDLVGWLLVPTLGSLLAMVVMAVWEVGILCGERWRGLRLMRSRGDIDALEDYARLRIERADMLARIAPMLGLMGTLIPLGPGIAALSRGQFEVLASAVSVAFDTTVIGLAVGIVGFLIGRLRRRWYDRLIDAWEREASRPADRTSEPRTERSAAERSASGALSTPDGVASP